MINKVSLIIAIIFLAIGSVVKGQGNDGDVLDPSGFVTKYDSKFNGIGPTVYVLPAPRTKEEELVDSYKEKKDFYDSISRQMDFQHLIEEYKITSNSGYLKQNFNPFPDTDDKWNQLLTKLEQNNNAILAAGLSNEYALQLLKNKEIDKAKTQLERGLRTIKATSFIREQNIIEYNLANLYLFAGNYDAAGSIHENVLRQAINNKELSEQANSLMSIALKEAYSKNYRAAENTVIRRAIPLYNKAKNPAGKVNAWIKLAKIYQLQNKHTEAQWFLIQARDLANAKNIATELLEIEYMLAYSKYIQQNYKVAIKEFEKAKSLADEENNKILQLAIHDKLGDIYLLMGNYQDAENELSQYWRLRKILF